MVRRVIAPAAPEEESIQLFSEPISEIINYWTGIQGDHSGCDKPPIDTDTNVAFWYKLLIIKRNFRFDVNGRFDTT